MATVDMRRLIICQPDLDMLPHRRPVPDSFRKIKIMCVMCDVCVYLISFSEYIANETENLRN